MPNWCANTLTVTHGDPATIKRFVQAVENASLCETFAPIGEWDYGTAVDTWGTKWDISNVEVIDIVGDTACVTFETAWSPPIGVYDALVQQGFGVNAEYFEPGVAFVGTYIDGVDTTYEITEDYAEDIPADLVETWGIAEMMDEWEDDDED